MDWPKIGTAALCALATLAGIYGLWTGGHLMHWPTVGIAATCTLAVLAGLYALWASK